MSVMIGAVVSGIVFLILFGWCLCLCRAGADTDDRVCTMQKKDDEKNSENIKKDIDSDVM